VADDRRLAGGSGGLAGHAERPAIASRKRIHPGLPEFALGIGEHLVGG